MPRPMRFAAPVIKRFTALPYPAASPCTSTSCDSTPGRSGSGSRPVQFAHPQIDGRRGTKPPAIAPMVRGVQILRRRSPRPSSKQHHHRPQYRFHGWEKTRLAEFVRHHAHQLPHIQHRADAHAGPRKAMNTSAQVKLRIWLNRIYDPPCTM